MAIIPKTEFSHPELGPIRFDDGVPITGSSDRIGSAPMWICRPGGWDSEFEIYLPGDANSPQCLEKAIAAFRHRDEIEAKGRGLCAPSVYLGWIDLTVDPPAVAFPDNDQVYTIWRGHLDDRLNVNGLKEGTW